MIADHFRLPVRFLRGSYTRLGLTVLALALGVALVCAIDLVNRGALQAFVEVVDTMAGRAALQVSAGQNGLFPEDVAASVGAVPGVELAVPVVSATAFTVDESGELLTVHGVDVANDAAVRAYDARDDGGLVVDDPLTLLNRPDAIVLTRVFAARRGLAIGDELALMTPSGAKRFVIHGLLDADGVARVYGGNLVVMDLYAAEAAFTRAGFVNRVDVVVARDQDVAQVSAAIAAVLPPGLSVEAPAQRKADLHKVMQALQVMLQGMGLIALVAAFLIAFNRLATLFEARAWQLGILRAVGVSSRALWRELLKESVLLGTAGVVLGIPLGIVLGRVLLPVIVATTALNANLVATEATLAIHASSLILAACLGLGAALLAAASPAWRAAQHAIADTMRSRGVEAPLHSAASMWLPRGIVAAAMVMAIGMQSVTRSAVWGLVATGLATVAVALLARPLVLLLASVPLRWRAGFAGPCGRFAAAALLRSPRRLALTTGTLGVGLGAVLWLWIVAQSFEQSLFDLSTGTLRADLIVASAHVASGWIKAPVDDGVESEVQAVPGVRSVAGERIIEWPYRGGPIVIHASDPAYFSDATFGKWPILEHSVSNPREAVGRGSAVLITSNFVLNLGLHAGDLLTLDTPAGPLTLDVAGVTTDFSSPRGSIHMSRDVYRRFWNDHQVNHVHVRTADGADVSAIRAAIARAVGTKYGVSILSSGELIAYFTSQVRRAFAVVPILAGLVLFVVLVGIADTLAAGVAERTREIGSLRAVGVRRQQLRRMIAVEALILGTFGLVLAATAGLMLGTLWVHATFPYLLGYVLDLHIPYRQGALVGVATVLVCLVAALMPARRAARLEPAAALRYE